MSNKIGCIVDVETTGLRPESDEIIEFAAILFSFNKENGEVMEVIEQHTYLREPISPTARENYGDAYDIHEIPFSDVKGKKFNDEIIKGIFSKTDLIIAHNATFDRSFLYQMYPEVNNISWYCSMRHIPWKDYGHINMKLITLAIDHQISNKQSHRALDDIALLFELLKRKSPKGDFYLKEILFHKPMRKYESTNKSNGKRNIPFLLNERNNNLIEKNKQLIKDAISRGGLGI